MSLTAGAILQTYNNTCQGSPTVQVIDIKKLGANNGADRYRLVISDGVHYQQAMLATQLNHYVESGSLATNCLVQLNECLCNTVSNKRIVIVLQLEVLGAGPGEAIGSPVNVTEAAAAPTPAAPAVVKQEKKQQVPSYMAGGNDNSSKWQHTSFHPISSLNPYQNRWTIKARVTAKSDIRTWSNARGDGKLCSVDFLDAQGGQIRATMFNDACDKFFPLFQENKVFVISRGQLKLANKKYSKLPNEYELTLNADAEVEYYGDDSSIETQKFEFCGIDQISQVAENESIDIIGVIKAVSEISTIMSQKLQKELTKRTVTLIDKSLTAIDITFWNQQAEKYNEELLGGNPVMAVKTLRVSDYGGKSLSTSFGTQVVINPDMKEAHDLKGWYDTQGKGADFENLSKGGGAGSGKDPRKNFEQIEDEGLGRNEKPDYFITQGTVTFYKHDNERPPWYNACPSEGCNKRVNPDEQGGWICEKCNKTYPTCQPRFILSVMACDASGSHWLNAFNDTAEQLLGKTAAEMNDLKQSGNEGAYEAVYEAANFKTFNFKIRAKSDTYQDETRVRCHIIGASGLDFKAESLLLLDQIEAY
jgi:replication factor A1